MSFRPSRVIKPCPVCGHLLHIRMNHETGHEFLGCSTWPDCDHTEEVPQDILMDRLGEDRAPRLEGF